MLRPNGAIFVDDVDQGGLLEEALHEMVRYPAKGCDRVVSSLLTLPTHPGGGMGPCRAGWGHPAPHPTPWTLLRAACGPQASARPALRRLQPRDPRDAQRAEKGPTTHDVVTQ
jgi:hypothetical protein